MKYLQKKNHTILISRLKSNLHQTVGSISVINDSGLAIFKACTLELPWLFNEKLISCIPVGNYDVKKRYSFKYGFHFELLNVPGRIAILIHSGNYYTQTHGCILVGSSFFDIDNDGDVDIINSKNTLKYLYSIMPDNFKMTIT